MYIECFGASSSSTIQYCWARPMFGPRQGTPISYEVGVLCAGSFRRVKPSGFGYLDMVVR